ncbi:hypothetical protein RJ639_039409 [Escallonia herrerae]|uniref:NADH dehydrogenase [ubiquinone] 1 alpha subcomplex subunit 12 n=1 Tax=Escallonia herrerae TaxID=1293975 RepID=A0AA88WHT8_9ASTE|nr:hypothetical protein RJ639_039409 [Escallonia herrerae]
MSRLWGKIAGLFSARTFAGADKAGNRYFFRKEEIDGILKEKRWVIFKGEDDPTSIPVEWICWLNGQRKIAPTSEEMAEMEARRQRVKLNVAHGKVDQHNALCGKTLINILFFPHQVLKKEEEERKVKEGSIKKAAGTSNKTKETDATGGMSVSNNSMPASLCCTLLLQNRYGFGHRPTKAKCKVLKKIT